MTAAMASFVILVTTSVWAKAEDSPWYNEYMPKASSETNAYPYLSLYPESFWSREAAIWSDSMYFFFAVAIPNTFRFLAATTIGLILWGVAYWVAHVLQRACSLCCWSQRTASRCSGYIRLGFTVFSLGFLLFIGIASLTLATWDRNLLFAAFPIGSLLGLSFFSGTMANLAAGVGLVVAGQIHVGVVVSFQSNTGMHVSGIVYEIDYLYLHILTLVSVKPNGPGSVFRAARVPYCEDIDNNASAAAFLRRNRMSLPSEFADKNNVVVWTMQVPLASVNNHVIAFPHAEPGAAVGPPPWAVQWTRKQPDTTQDPHSIANSPRRLYALSLSAAGRDVIARHVEHATCRKDV